MQDAAYKESVLPRAITARVSMEAGVTPGWERYLGLDGIALGIDRYGASAPQNVVYDKLGLKAAPIVAAALSLVR